MDGLFYNFCSTNQTGEKKTWNEKNLDLHPTVATEHCLLSPAKKKSRKKKKNCSPTGNRTPVSRVTGGDTYNYTIEEMVIIWKCVDKRSASWPLLPTLSDIPHDQPIRTFNTSENESFSG